MIQNLFKNESSIQKVRKKLPYIFQIAEIDSSRAGRIGMEVGSLRERILIALLVNEFGTENVETEIPITKHEVDVVVSGKSFSIKQLPTRMLLDSS